VVVSQDLQCDGEKHGVNKDKNYSFLAFTANNQSESDKNILETRRTSKIKKITSTRGEDFLWFIYHAYIFIY
jgi:hypothetical protein